MYIRTPKRYRRRQRRHSFSCQRLMSIAILACLIMVGIVIYQMRDRIAPEAMTVIQTQAAQVERWQATQFAPTPQPTRNPVDDLISADNEWNAGRIDFALDIYKDVLAAVPNDVNLHSRVTEGYLTRGHLADAQRYAEQAVTADPFSADAWAIRSLTYSWQGDFAEGIVSAQQALALDPQSVQGLAFLSYAYFVADENNIARSRADDAIASNPDHWSGYWARGLLFENVLPIDVEAAQADFARAYERVRQQNPAMAGSVGAALGRTYIALGDVEQAITLYNEVLNNDSSNRDSLYWLGRTYFEKRGEWVLAAEQFRDCVDIAPQDYNCWYMLGRSLNNEDEQEEALLAFEQAVDLNTPYARHYWWAGNITRVTSSCTAAQHYFETGYDMVKTGGLPARDEGDSQLLQDFESELSVCRITVLPDNPTAQPTPNPTATP